MRTWKMMINQADKKNAAFCRYLQANTADAKCMYNTANFYVRNTMTGLRKSPEERTALETEVLHNVFTGIQKANEMLWQKRVRRLSVLAHTGGMTSAVEAHSLTKDRFRYPTAKHWFLSYETLDAVFKATDNPVYRRMNSQVNQNAIRKLEQAWKGYFKSLKEYQRSPSEFLGKPRIPGYLREERGTAWFTSQTAKFLERDGKCFLRFVNLKEPFCIGKASLYAGLKYVKTEVKPVHGRYVMLVTFDDQLKAVPVPAAPSRILGLDPGVVNFLGVGNNFGAVPFVVKGGALKAAGQWFHKKYSKLLSSLTRGKDSSHSRKTSSRLDALSRKREAFLRDYFYKCAWYLCRYAVKHRVEVIVVGHTPELKQKSNMGRQNNQDYVSIPYLKFHSALKAVAGRCGIAVVIREEKYTSKISLLDMDMFPSSEEDDFCFSGKRIRRGLYRSREGILLNADINAACNIIRKEYPSAFAGQKDLSYLYKTTEAVHYKDLYANASSVHGRSKKHKCHKSGSGSRARQRYRKERRIVYQELWGKGKTIWKEESTEKSA